MLNRKDTLPTVSLLLRIKSEVTSYCSATVILGPALLLPKETNSQEGGGKRSHHLACHKQGVMESQTSEVTEFSNFSLSEGAEL